MCMAAQIARTLANRHVLAIVAATTVLAAAAAPFWASRLLLSASGACQRAIAWWIVAADPLATLGTLWGGSPFTRPLMYDFSALARDVSPQGPAWYVSVLIYLAAALVLGVIAGMRRRGERPESRSCSV